MTDNQNSLTADDPTHQVLVVKKSREGNIDELLSQEHGPVSVPDNWQFLPPGNACVTRQVKKGPHWILQGNHSKGGGYTPTLGYYAPIAAIEAAQEYAQATEKNRMQSRRASNVRREKLEMHYKSQFKQSCLDFLSFRPEHVELANSIATAAMEHACEKSSGRVGRTNKIGLEEKAEFAVRAHLRHVYTPYEETLSTDPNKDEYRDLKAGAQFQVDAFLSKHRDPPQLNP